MPVNILFLSGILSHTIVSVPPVSNAHLPHGFATGKLCDESVCIRRVICVWLTIPSYSQFISWVIFYNRQFRVMLCDSGHSLAIVIRSLCSTGFEDITATHNNRFLVDIRNPDSAS